MARPLAVAPGTARLAADRAGFAELDEIDADNAPRFPAGDHGKVLGREAGHGQPRLVERDHVHGEDIDAAAERGLLLRGDRDAKKACGHHADTGPVATHA